MGTEKSTLNLVNDGWHIYGFELATCVLLTACYLNVGMYDHMAE